MKYGWKYGEKNRREINTCWLNEKFTKELNVIYEKWKNWMWDGFESNFCFKLNDNLKANNTQFMLSDLNTCSFLWTFKWQQPQHILRYSFFKISFIILKKCVNILLNLFYIYKINSLFYIQLFIFITDFFQ